MPALFDLRDVELRYGAGAVIGPFTLALDRGQRAGLAGASGSGKTTVLDWIAGTVPPALAAAKACVRADRVCYISQEASDSLSPYMTALDQVAAFGRDASECLSRVGLDDARQRSYPSQLSGGERKRVQVAQALAMRPDLILADEPTTNLDADNSEAVLRALDECGAAMVVASHQESAFARLRCDSVVRLTPRRETPAWTELPTPGRVLVSVRGVTFAHTRRDFWLRRVPTGFVLRDVSFEIRESETVLLGGPSGAGKSTLARCLAKLGQCAVQLVPQEPSGSLNPRQTLRAAIGEASADADPGAVLEPVDIPAAWLDRRCSELSEGQRARVAIARALAALPRGGLLILDESFAGLDPETCHRVYSTISAAQRRTGLACLVIAHSAVVPAHRALHMREGRFE
ncbi:MAG: ATP-binding cassette domain-containing protein [Bryobacteraceae bacterium]